jgi:FdhD protein
MRPAPSVIRTMRYAYRAGEFASAERSVPEEMPVALSYAGTTHAVMMASPADLEDFAVGFSLTEGIIASPDEIESVTIEDLETGADVQIRLKDTANTRFEARRRRLAGPVGCGLCGIESIDEAVRGPAMVDAVSLMLTPSEITDAVRLLSDRQPLHAQTGAVHAAGFYIPGQGIVLVREDVGRHNALDKLAGGLAKQGIDGSRGTVVVTSRVSLEMVQKTTAIGSPIILAVSAPTALAIRTADAAGLTLIALVRGDDFDVFTRTDRVSRSAATSPDKHHPQHAKIVRMANQIGTFFSSKQHDEGVAGIAEHINKFWEPRMRRQFFEVIDAGGIELQPIVIEAAASIRRPAAETAAG